MPVPVLTFAAGLLRLRTIFEDQRMFFIEDENN